MPFHKLPAGTVARRDHPFQRSLDLLDAELLLAQNTTNNPPRYEIWRTELTPRGMLYSGILPVEDAQGRPIYDLGDWLTTRLRARDSRYRPAKEAAEEVLSELREQERKDLEADEHRLDAVHEELALDYLPLWRQKADPHSTGKRYHDLDKAPVIFDMGPKDAA